MTLSFIRSKKTEDDVIVDRATGTFNRRRLDRDLAAGVDAFGLPTATLVLHVENFEQLSKLGAVSVDQILERIAWVVKATVRTSDTVYRDSDSSFCVRMPKTTDDEASIAAERIQSNIESTPLLTDSTVTVSVDVVVGGSGQVSNAAHSADAAPGQEAIASH
jgi:two-component system cell cycle response regulator